VVNVLPSPQVRSPARLLVVTDRQALAQLVILTLNHGVYVSRVATTRAEATALLDRWRPQLVLLDMDVAGAEVLAHLGALPTGAERPPVIALTRRGDLKSKLQASERGVDDILTVPFSPEELVARALAVMRRTYRDAFAFTPTLTVGELELDILNRQVRIGGHALELTGLEQGLLDLLAANAGRVMSRDEILDSLWGPDFVAGSNLVDQHVRQLRSRLQNDWKRPRYIATVPGRGYRFLATTAADADAPAPA
jgi:DNA-binding response OmpR family regulator